MAMLLIAVDDADAPGNPRRGDVILVVPDSYSFGQRELDDPRWRILRVRGAPPKAFADLLGPELPTAEGAKHRALCHYRAFYLELDAELTEPLHDFLADGERLVPAYDLGLAEVRAMVTRRPSLQPAVGIG